MSDGRRLTRSRNALIGGVCAGVAGYFNIDPLVVRIFAVVLTVLSAGMLGVAYLGMWVVLPKETPADAPLEVEPEEVHSATFGCVDCARARGAADPASAAQAAAERYAAPYYGTGHVSPEPPVAAMRAGASAPVPPPTEVEPKGDAPCAHTPLSRGTVAAIVVGSLLLAAGIVYVLNALIGGLSWWQCWPLVLVILGIVRMVVPGCAGRRMRAFVEGLVCFFAGETLLVMSLGIASWSTLGAMASNLWPLLLASAILLSVGLSAKLPLLTLAGGLCFAGFCVAGLLLFSVPGPVTEVSLTMPYGRQYYLPLRS